MRHILIVPIVIALCGCASTADFNRAMEKPAAAAKNAADVAKGAEQDIVLAHALGVYKPDPEPAFPAVLCWPSKGPDVAGSQLLTFADALETVNKVAEKPADTSYAAYIRKFADNEAARSRDFSEESAKALEEIKAARERCEMLAAADAKGRLIDPSGVGVFAAPPLVGSILALDQLIKTVLAQAEKAQRAAAIRATIQHLLPQLRAASKALSAEAGPAFGPLVTYPSGTSAEAVEMNTSVLGAVITVRRWSVAARANAQWNALDACRKAAPSVNCMGRHNETALAESLVANIYTYRALARIDTQKLLASLNKATDGAEAAASGTSIGGLLDALIGIGDALSGISDKYAAYRKTRE